MQETQDKGHPLPESQPPGAIGQRGPDDRGIDSGFPGTSTRAPEQFDPLGHAHRQLRDLRAENAELQDQLEERRNYVVLCEARLLQVYDTLFEIEHGAPDGT